MQVVLKNFSLKVSAGIILVLISGWVLFINETRIEKSNAAKAAIEVISDNVNLRPLVEGKLVSVTGNLSSSQLLGDGLYLKPGNHIVVKRTVEMFSWMEGKKTKAAKTSDEAKAFYSKKWLEFPPPMGNKNPQKSLESFVFKVPNAKVGMYEIDMSMINFPALSLPPLTEKNTAVRPGTILASKRYLFSGKGTVNSPEIGDLRISYSVFPSGEKVTVFGKKSGKLIAPYLDQQNIRLYRMFSGNRNRALAELRSERKIPAWIIRLAGIIAVLTGFSMLFDPLQLWILIRKAMQRRP